MSESPDPTPAVDIDPRDFRNALGMFATGVSIVTTCNGEGRPIGLTCNSFSSVSLKPPLILWSLSLYSPNLQTFLQVPCFAVNILACDQLELSRRFSTPQIDRFAGVEWVAGENGIPLLAGAAAQIQCRSEARHYSGDHVILIGQVLRYVYRDVEPLVFARGRYRALTNLPPGED
jgi:flavin reductase (DIM6/NTAB) family NADH-FMN oxidoreductase RutF